MRNTISPWLSAITLFLIIASVSCSSFAKPSPPQLGLRVLDLDPERPGVAIYQYQVCVKKFLGLCVKHEPKREEFWLADFDTWRQFVAMDFVLRARVKP